MERTRGNFFHRPWSPSHGENLRGEIPISFRSRPFGKNDRLTYSHGTPYGTRGRWKSPVVPSCFRKGMRRRKAPLIPNSTKDGTRRSHPHGPIRRVHQNTQWIITQWGNLTSVEILIPIIANIVHRHLMFYNILYNISSISLHGSGKDFPSCPHYFVSWKSSKFNKVLGLTRDFRISTLESVSKFRLYLGGEIRIWLLKTALEWVKLDWDISQIPRKSIPYSVYI